MRALHTVHEVHDAPGVVPGKDDGKGRKRLRADDAVRLEIVEQARADGYVTMRESCRDLVLRGITTAEEAARTISTTVDD